MRLRKEAPKTHLVVFAENNEYSFHERSVKVHFYKLTPLTKGIEIFVISAHLVYRKKQGLVNGKLFFSKSEVHQNALGELRFAYWHFSFEEKFPQATPRNMLFLGDPEKVGVAIPPNP